jgi:hypothetical protein
MTMIRISRIYPLPSLRCACRFVLRVNSVLTYRLYCSRCSPSQPLKISQVYCKREKRRNIRSVNARASVMTSESVRDKCAWQNFVGARICPGLSLTDAIPRRILSLKLVNLHNFNVLPIILVRNNHN